jgi:parallel beta-helix repeat protein
MRVVTRMLRRITRSVRRGLLVQVWLAGLLAWAAPAAGRLAAAEYFVAPGGADAADGLGPNRAFRTVQQGIDALQPGDTLTILPGEYREAVARAGLGSPDRETVIRASIPGTVLLRGDVPPPRFEPVAGTRFVHAAEFAGDPQALIEADTLRIVERRPDAAAVEFEPGTFHYDATTRRLFVSTSDLRPPESHVYSVCVTPRSGLLLEHPRRVRIEGLATTGFYRASQAGSDRGRSNVWGISLCGPEGCTVRDCTSYLNAGAICIDRGSGNVIDGCVAYGNRSAYHLDGGGIIAFSPDDDCIRGCTSFLNAHKGIECYLNRDRPARLADNLAWGNIPSDIQLKGGDRWQAERCVGLGTWSAEVRFHYLTHCLIGSIPAPLAEHSDRRNGNLVLADHRGIDPDLEFASPSRHDYRLQSTSRFRGAAADGTDLGPFPYAGDVAFVSPAGDDSADGRSVKTAWRSLDHACRSLEPGQTLYLEPGTYHAAGPITVGSADRPSVRIAARGRGTAIVAGPLTIAGSARVTFDSLHFAGTVAVEDGRDVRFEHCSFRGEPPLVVRRTRSLEVSHGLFVDGGPVLDAVDAARFSGTVFGAGLRMDRSTVLHSDYNAYPDPERCWIVDGVAVPWDELRGRHDLHSQIATSRLRLAAGVPLIENATAFAARGPLGTPQGPFSFTALAVPELRLEGPFVRNVSDSTATVEWWTSLPGQAQIAWGEEGGPLRTATFDAPQFATFSLTGLAPGKSHRFTIKSLRVLPHLDPLGVGTLAADASVAFTTLDKPLPPRTIHVSTTGDDAATGLDPVHPVRTIARAARDVLPGDTVLVAEGVYRESVTVRGTGAAGRPVRFRAAPGARVVLDGADRSLRAAFVLTGKSSIELDGFHFRGYGLGNERGDWLLMGLGVVTAYASDSIHISRCLMDGRGTFYSPPFVAARESSHLRVDNCVVTTGMHNLHADRCPDLVLEHNVFIRPMIFQAAIGSGSTVFRRNIFTDNIPNKEVQPLFELSNPASVVFEDNCFHLRASEDRRRQKMLRFLGDPRFGAEPLDRLATMAQYDAVTSGSRTLFADPAPAGAAAITVPAAADGRPPYAVDAFMKSPHLQVGAADELEFHHFFATNPEVRERGIGLDPAAFAAGTSHGE